MIKLNPAKYMMATKAEHGFAGDISREEPDLCQISAETDDFYIGSWIEGFGFIDVKFPKATTRELTEAEKEHYNGMHIGIPGSWSYQIKMQSVADKPEKPMETP